MESAVAAQFELAGHLALTSPWLSPSSSSGALARFLAEMERVVQRLPQPWVRHSVR